MTGKVALLLQSASSHQNFYTTVDFLYLTWGWAQWARALGKPLVRSGTTRENLVCCILVCVLSVMFYLAPQLGLSTTGVLTNSVRVVSNNRELWPARRDQLTRDHSSDGWLKWMNSLLFPQMDNWYPNPTWALNHYTVKYTAWRIGNKFIKKICKWASFRSKVIRTIIHRILYLLFFLSRRFLRWLKPWASKEKQSTTKL